MPAAKPRWGRPLHGLLVAIQIGLMVLVAMGPRSLGAAEAWAAPWNTIARVVGIALGLCGGLLALGAARRMGPHLTPSPQPREDAPLIIGGAYGLVRHPMYGGVILTAFGWALLVNGPLTLLYACLLFTWLDVKSRYEERLLEAAYEGYATYRSRVRKLVPFVY